jgi:hypothetical protein
VDKTNIYACFSIYGDFFDPDEITKILGVAPTKTHLKGDIIPLREGLTRTKKKKYKETDWSLETAYRISMDINDGISEIMGRIGCKKEELSRIRKGYDVKFLFSFCVYIYDAMTPGMCFSESFIKFAGDIGARIDVDTYVI